ncbi:hypothetical protein B0H14DRAFT_2626434 [Mycena olivaceomarginata]|nr:hypothetical protein B0H14DRAFT_2626434 [Mycena olivaceomarginata]
MWAQWPNAHRGRQKGGGGERKIGRRMRNIGVNGGEQDVRIAAIFWLAVGMPAVLALEKDEWGGENEEDKMTVQSPAACALSSWPRAQQNGHFARIVSTAGAQTRARTSRLVGQTFPWARRRGRKVSPWRTIKSLLYCTISTSLEGLN